MAQAGLQTGRSRRRFSRQSRPLPPKRYTLGVSPLTIAILVCGTSLGTAAVAGAATLKVTTTNDEMTFGDGQCSLREAIATIDVPGTNNGCGTASKGSNTIVLPAGTYSLSIQPAGSDGISTGDLNVYAGTSSLRVIGAGAGRTTIAGGGLSFGDRLLSIAQGMSVTIARLTLTGGRAPDGSNGANGASDTSTDSSAGQPGGQGGDGQGGGAILNQGVLTLTAVTVAGNQAGSGGNGGTGGTGGGPGGAGGAGGGDGTGGGIFNSGTGATLTVISSTISANHAGYGGVGGTGGTAESNPAQCPPNGSPAGRGGAGGIGEGGGGGIANQSGRVVIDDSTITLNEAGIGGAGGTGGNDNPACDGYQPGTGGKGGTGSWGGGLSSIGGSLSVINSTVVNNSPGPGGQGGQGGYAAEVSGNGGNGGQGGHGGGIRVTDGSSTVADVTLASNTVGTGGGPGSHGQCGLRPDCLQDGSNGMPGASGQAGGIYVQSSSQWDNMVLRNSIVASNQDVNCLGTTSLSIANGGHNLSFGDTTCPAVSNSDPMLGDPHDNGGPTETLAFQPGSPAINAVPATGAGCPATDQRGVKRPQGTACDIGAFEFAIPTITITTPGNGARYKRGARVLAEFRCREGGIASPIATCNGTVANRHLIDTSSPGTKSFTVTATDKTGNPVSKTVHYTVTTQPPA